MTPENWDRLGLWMPTIVLLFGIGLLVGVARLIVWLIAMVQR